MVLAHQTYQQLGQEVDQLARLAFNAGSPEAVIVYPHPPGEELQQHLKELDRLEDHAVVGQDDPVPVNFALDFSQLLLQLLSEGVVRVQLLDVLSLPFHLLLHLLVVHEVFHGTTDADVEELQSQEEELCDGAKLFFICYFGTRPGADDVSLQEGGLLVVDEVSGVNILPLIVLHVCDGLAESEEAGVAVYEEAVMRQFAILLVVEPMHQLRPLHVAQQHPVVPLQEGLLALLPHQLPVGLEQLP